MTLEGLGNHEAMRDFLYSRMRGSHEKHAPGAASVTRDPLAGTLAEIAGELRAIREALEKRSHA
jgi:putative membrane protein